MNYKTITYGGHQSQFFHVYHPVHDLKKKIKGMCIFLHGGFFKEKYDLTLMSALAEDLKNDGYLAVNIEYPRVGENVLCKNMIQSVRDAYDLAVQMFSEQVEKTIVIGHSAGGYYALKLGLERTPNIVIAQAPLSDLARAYQEKLSDEGDAVENFVTSGNPKLELSTYLHKLSPINQNPSPDCAIHIVHGVNDKDVPFAHSVSLIERWNNAGNVSLHGLSNVDHYNVIDPSHPSWKFQKALMNL